LEAVVDETGAGGETDTYGFGALFGGDTAAMAALGTAEPQPTYAAKAAACPIVRVNDGRVSLLRMADVLALNKDHRVRGTGAIGNSMGGTRPLIPLDLDGPEHTKYRRVLDPMFAPRRVAALEPQIRRLANEIIDGFIDRGEVDVYAEWCQPLPSTIFLSMMGIPQSDLARFLSFKNAILGHDAAPTDTVEEIWARIQQASRECYAYFDAVLDDRAARTDPGDDLIGWLVRADVQGGRLSREEIQDICYLLMIAGLDTVAASLACMLSFFARNPGHRKEVVADPSLWPTAVEELMRFESPVTEGHRVPQEDIELGGTTIAAGTMVTVSWSAANLDPETFADPLRVDLRREPNPHVAFANGWHRCLGSHLARLELRAALDEFHRRIPDYRIADGCTLEYTGNPRTPRSLPLVWG
jgi:cytochrome P450